MEGRIEKLISEMTLKEKLGQLTQELTSLERLDELEELARKGELGFDGFVISDWDAVKRLSCQGVSDNDETSATLAINAGVDMDMVDCLYKNNLKSAVEKRTCVHVSYRRSGSSCAWCKTEIRSF